MTLNAPSKLVFLLSLIICLIVFGHVVFLTFLFALPKFSVSASAHAILVGIMTSYGS